MDTIVNEDPNQSARGEILQERGFDLRRIFGVDGTPIFAQVHTMIAAYAKTHGHAITVLHVIEQTLREDIAEQQPLSQKALTILTDSLERVRVDAVELGYNETANHVQRKIKELKEGWYRLQDLPSDIKNIRERFADDATKLLLFHVEPDGVKYHEKPQVFGPDIATKFTDAQRDLTEAGTCYSLGCSTACVLHLMRALESVLRTSAGSIAPTIVIGHKETMGAVALKLKQSSTSLPSTTAAELDRKNKVSRAAMHFQDITSAMRNTAMHTGEFFSMSEAGHALVSTELFLRDLLDLV